MKLSIFAMVLIFAVAGNAEVKHAQASIQFAPYEDGTGASIVIKGETAKQLYSYLDVPAEAGPGRSKVGSNITCQKLPLTAQGFMGTEYMCAMLKVSRDGNISN